MPLDVVPCHVGLERALPTARQRRFGCRLRELLVNPDAHNRTGQAIFSCLPTAASCPSWGLREFVNKRTYWSAQ